jgi:hypothetical protein
MFDTVDAVRDLLKQRSDCRTPLERQVVDLLKAMIVAGLTEHRAFDALYELHGYLTVPGELEHELFIHRRWEGELVEAVPGVYVDMVKAVNRRRTLTPDRTAILTPSVRRRCAGHDRSCGA